MKFIVNSSSLENDFNQSKGPVTFFDNIKKLEILMENVLCKSENLIDTSKNLRTVNRCEKEKND